MASRDTALADEWNFPSFSTQNNLDFAMSDVSVRLANGSTTSVYIRVWADKDVNHLKHLIDLTVRWIENEVETEQVLQDMTK